MLPSLDHIHGQSLNLPWTLARTKPMFSNGAHAFSRATNNMWYQEVPPKNRIFAMFLVNRRQDPFKNQTNPFASMSLLKKNIYYKPYKILYTYKFEFHGTPYKTTKKQAKKTLFPSLWIHLAKSQIAARAPSHCAGHEGNPGFSSEAKSNYRFTICRYLMISICR